MTKVKIKKIDIHNFLSFTDEEWDFSSTSNLVLIKGINKDTSTPTGIRSNGSGKSTITRALLWSLFGRMEDDDGEVLVATTKNLYSDTKRDGFTMFVTVELESVISKDVVKRWRIVRGLPQKSKSLTLQLLAWDEETNDWKDISKSTTSHTQKFIEDNVVMMNLEMYKRIILLTDEDKYNFFKLNAAQKRTFVETLFDTSVYTKMYKMLNDDFKTKNMVMQNLKVNKLQLEKTKELCEDEIEKYKASVNDQIETTKQEIVESQSKVDEFQPQFDSIEKQKTIIQEALEKTRVNKEKLDAIIKTCNDNITNARIDINNCKTTISHHERELNKHKEVLGMICEDCKAVVNKFYSLDVYRKEIENLKSKISEQETSIENSNKQIEKIKFYDDKMKEEEMNRMGELSDAQVQERNLQFQRSQLMNTISQLERKVADLVESIDNKNKIPSYNLYQRTLDDIVKVEEELRGELTNLCLLKVGADIVSPDAIKKNIISKVVSSINAMINRNLNELGVSFTCNLSYDMNDYEIMSSGGKVGMANLSAGERATLRLSLQLAVRKFLMSRFNVGMNVMIIDEVLDGALDSVSIKQLLGMLLRISQKENTNISIISHRAEVEEMVKGMPDTKTVVIQKEKNISKIIKE